MKNAIIVSYEPFIQESRVFVIKDGEKELISISSDIQSLSEALVGFAYGYEIYSVKISGPFAIMNEIKNNVKLCEQKLYSETKIKVEGT